MHLCEGPAFAATFGQRKYVVKPVGNSGHIKYFCIEYQYWRCANSALWHHQQWRQ